MQRTNLAIEHNCHHCPVTMVWVYDLQEGDLKPKPISGCAGDGCTEVHELHARMVTDEEAGELLDKRYWR